MSACRSRGVPRLGRTRIGFTFGLSARAGAGGHGATLGHAPAPRGGYSGQCAKPLRMATRDPTLDRRAHLLGSQSQKVTSTPLRPPTLAALRSLITSVTKAVRSVSHRAVAPLAAARRVALLVVEGADIILSAHIPRMYDT